MTPFGEAYDRAQRQMERGYGIPARRGDVVDPNTGDFDGTEITVDHDQAIDSALFVLVHLFGHTVEWNLFEEDRRTGFDLSIGKGEAELAKICDYEQRATRYGLQLLHEAGVEDLDGWLSDWWAADWKYLSHYYRTGEKLEVRSLFVPKAGAVLSPLPIPPFTPRKWGSRWAF
jgi:hypothetical protein